MRIPLYDHGPKPFSEPTGWVHNAERMWPAHWAGCFWGYDSND
ncbi:MAG: hypothetical protein JWQ55_5604 [Rhodopila sp.]|jgi:hypothetical protein|nr:hypothetical protein [Rhodopila sp.]